MRKILGDLGTMFLGISAILIASVIISIGTYEGPKLVSIVGSIGLGVVGIILRMLSSDPDNTVDNG